MAAVRRRKSGYRIQTKLNRMVLNRPQPMAPRSPLVGIARNIHGVVIHKELSVSYDSMFGVPRYREKLITVSSGLKIYSLEEQT